MGFEFFNTYTEVDANNKLTVGTRKILSVDLDRDENGYIYKDYGADYFDALDVDFDIYVSSDSLNQALAAVAITNTVNTIPNFVATDLVVYATRATNNVTICLWRGVAVASDNKTGLSLDTVYYCTITRAAGNDTATCAIYSDEARQNLIDTLSVAGFGTEKWQYIFGFINYNNRLSGRDFDGYIANVDLNEATPRAVWDFFSWS